MTAIVSFEDSVKLRLKGIVAELIPEEKWDGLVRTAVLEFEKHDLPKLVKAELTAKYQECIKAEFQKPEWQAKWMGTNQGVSDAVKNLMVEAAPLILAGLLGSAMNQTVQHFQNLVHQRPY